MISPRKATRPGGVGIEHTLFVEGNKDEALDPTVIGILLSKFKRKLKVEPLGSSLDLRSAAQALHKYHPNYYFLIDRDHCDDATVENFWKNFPVPDTPNLLVWRRRELENYFIIPDYLEKTHRSENISFSPEEVRQAILEQARLRLYLDAANQVIIGIRETLKANWIKAFRSMSDFQSREAALRHLTDRPEWSSQELKTSQLLAPANLAEEFHRILHELTGGRDPIEFGTGLWLERLRGKEILPTVINRCCQVRADNGSFLQGDERLKEVAKTLVGLPLHQQPQDFQDLHALMQRVAG